MYVLKEGSTKTILDMPVHGSATCVKCKFKIEYMETLLTILISHSLIGCSITIGISGNISMFCSFSVYLENILMFV